MADIISFPVPQTAPVADEDGATTVFFGLPGISVTMMLAPFDRTALAQPRKGLSRRN